MKNVVGILVMLAIVLGLAYTVPLVPYITKEQFYCKVMASGDFLSQGVCYMDFERRFPPR